MTPQNEKLQSLKERLAYMENADRLSWAQQLELGALRREYHAALAAAEQVTT